MSGALLENVEAGNEDEDEEAVEIEQPTSSSCDCRSSSYPTKIRFGRSEDGGC